tara:strand:- start:1199 stop:1360 length:162 start_codon:yes stop_codon:yes gene_type:complete
MRVCEKWLNVPIKDPRRWKVGDVGDVLAIIKVGGHKISDYLTEIDLEVTARMM